MTTVQINERTKIGKSILEMLKALSKNDSSIKILDETDYLLSSEANRQVLIQGVEQVKNGDKGKTIKPSEMWKIDFIGKANEDLEFWKSSGNKTIQRKVVRLLDSISKTPHSGIGNPE